MSAEITTITTGLKFPEGPIAMPDGSIVLVEIAARRLTRVQVDGSKSTIVELQGGPNGAAIGPDGRCYVCNNGGMNFIERDGLLIPAPAGDDAGNGWIEAVDLETGDVERLYGDCDGKPLIGPNDIVFDDDGGMWFTDHGKSRRGSRDMGGMYYARADGSGIKRVVGHLDGANGIGLAPDGREVYVAETSTGRLWGFAVAGPGEIAVSEQRPAQWLKGRLVANPPGLHMFDSLAMDADGNVAVASIPNGIVNISPDGAVVDQFGMPDPFPTNICFGGEDLRTAFITLSGAGHLVSMQWPRAGLPLHGLNQ